jgi:hypothetical protein
MRSCPSQKRTLSPPSRRFGAGPHARLAAADGFCNGVRDDASSREQRMVDQTLVQTGFDIEVHRDHPDLFFRDNLLALRRYRFPYVPPAP